MSTQTIGLIIGGLIPAVLFGITNTFMKASTETGIGLAPLLIITGFGVATTGFIFLFVGPDWTLSAKSGMHAAGIGLSWGIGIGLVAIALSKYSTPASKLVPLYNMNTLIAVVLALWIFSEWKEVSIAKLFIGALLIVIGGILVAKS